MNIDSIVLAVKNRYKTVSINKGGIEKEDWRRKLQ